MSETTTNTTTTTTTETTDPTETTSTSANPELDSVVYELKCWRCGLHLNKDIDTADAMHPDIVKHFMENPDHYMVKGEYSIPSQFDDTAARAARGGEGGVSQDQIQQQQQKQVVDAQKQGEVVKSTTNPATNSTAATNTVQQGSQ